MSIQSLTQRLCCDLSLYSHVPPSTVSPQISEKTPDLWFVLRQYTPNSSAGLGFGVALCCSDLSPPGSRAPLTCSPPCLSPKVTGRGVPSPRKSFLVSLLQAGVSGSRSSLSPHCPNSCLQGIKPQPRVSWGEHHAEYLAGPSLERRISCYFEDYCVLFLLPSRIEPKHLPTEGR